MLLISGAQRVAHVAFCTAAWAFEPRWCKCFIVKLQSCHQEYWHLLRCCIACHLKRLDQWHNKSLQYEQLLSSTYAANCQQKEIWVFWAIPSVLNVPLSGKMFAAASNTWHAQVVCVFVHNKYWRSLQAVSQAWPRQFVLTCYLTCIPYMVAIHSRQSLVNMQRQ